MVAAAKKQSPIEFVTAGGIMAHYVGDASQPLHSSVLHHGIGPTKKTINGTDYPYRHADPEYRAYNDSAKGGVHHSYEQAMFETDTAALLNDFDALLVGTPLADERGITNGWGAALELFKLMERSRTALSPMDIISADDASLAAKPRALHFWNNQSIRDKTVAFLADSTQTLAALWISAWQVGNGDAIPQSELVAFTQSELMAIYRAPGYATPLNLAQMKASGKFEPP